MASTIEEKFVVGSFGGIIGAGNLKQPVRVASNVLVDTATGGEISVDGVALTTGDRVLLTTQATAAANGIYVVSSGSWSRASDFDGSSIGDVLGNTLIPVESGTLFAGKMFRLLGSGVLVVTVNDMNFELLDLGAKHFDAIVLGSDNAATDKINIDAAIAAVTASATAKKSIRRVGTFRIGNAALAASPHVTFVDEGILWNVDTTAPAASAFHRGAGCVIEGAHTIRKEAGTLGSGGFFDGAKWHDFHIDVTANDIGTLAVCSEKGAEIRGTADNASGNNHVITVNGRGSKVSYYGIVDETESGGTVNLNAEGCDFEGSCETLNMDTQTTGRGRVVNLVQTGVLNGSGCFEGNVKNVSQTGLGQATVSGSIGNHTLSSISSRAHLNFTTTSQDTVIDSIALAGGSKKVSITGVEAGDIPITNTMSNSTLELNLTTDTGETYTQPLTIPLGSSSVGRNRVKILRLPGSGISAANSKLILIDARFCPNVDVQLKATTSGLGSDAITIGATNLSSVFHCTLETSGDSVTILDGAAGNTIHVYSDTAPVIGATAALNNAVIWHNTDDGSITNLGTA